MKNGCCEICVHWPIKDCGSDGVVCRCHSPSGNQDWEGRVSWADVPSQIGATLTISTQSGAHLTYVETRLKPEERKGIRELISLSLKDSFEQGKQEGLREVEEEVKALRNKWARSSVWKETYRTGYNQAVLDFIKVIRSLSSGDADKQT